MEESIWTVVVDGIVARVVEVMSIEVWASGYPVTAADDELR